MIDVTYIDKQIAHLVEYRKRYETPFEGEFSLVKNHVRNAYLFNVDDKIRSLKMEKDWMGQADDSYMLAAGMGLFHGSADLGVDRDGNLQAVSFMVTLFEGYEEILWLNVEVVKRSDVTVTEFPQFLNYDLEKKTTNKYQHLKYKLVEFPRGCLSMGSMEKVLESVLRLFKQKKTKYLYYIRPECGLNNSTPPEHVYRIIINMV